MPSAPESNRSPGWVLDEFANAGRENLDADHVSRYDAKEEGFSPGGASLHNCMSGHGPDDATFEKASRADTSQPQYLDGTMAFMFETRTVLCPTAAALALPQLQEDYAHCWSTLPKHFSPLLVRAS